MGVLLTIAGILVIAVGLYDIFHTLLHPSGQGPLSSRVMAAVWKFSKAIGHRSGSTVGPLGMATVVLMWAVLQGVGWALIYLPHVPGGFMYSAGVDPADYPDFAGALYVSLTSLSTLGFGDVVPTDPWIRLAAPVQALTGFALLTAALTWFTQIYPAMARRRSLALKLKRLADVGYIQAVGQVEAATLNRTLETLAAEVSDVRIDLTQHSEGFYFRERDQELSLAHQLFHALELRDAAAATPAPEVRLGAQQLSEALDHLAQKLRADFVSTGDSVEEIFAAYANDHGQTGTG
ncbi:hypothetical protein GCM10023169_32210 [Georgenia halophila]|uniref:Potassium channel domain-containing protein n=1 Tax=Georgenia halophila TaxID=620889 RepID=A0ABP8LH96_9MICO